MNIGSMIRGLLGDSKPGAAKSLELKEGQIVRGVVLSVSDSGKEAIVQIQGTPVRAELETPLQPGQTMNLQVAPPGEGGLPVLKPVSLGEAALVSTQSMGEALEMLGLTDSKAGSEIVKAMQSGGIALTKETAAKLDAVMNAKPAGVSTSEWLDAAVISVKRGLPVTAESVKGLQQAIFGPQLHQLLSTLEEQINIWARQEAGKGASTAGTNEGKLVTPQTAEVLSGINTGSIDSGDAEVDSAKLAGKGNAQATGQAVEGKAGRPEIPHGLSTTRGVDESEGEVKISFITSETPENETGALSGKAVAVGETKNGIGTAVVITPSVTANGASNSAVSTNKDGSTNSAISANEDGSTNSVISANKDGAQNSAVSTNKDGAQNSAISTNKDGTAVQMPAPRSAATTEHAVAIAAPAEPAGASAGEAAGKAAAPSGAALLAKLQGVLTELRGTLPQLAVAPPASAAGQDLAPAAAAPRGETPAAAMPEQPGSAPTHETESWVGRVLKLLGAEHEQQAVRGFASVAAEVARTAAATPAAEGRPLPLAAAAMGSAEVGVDNAADTLKGVLLQIMGSSEVPPAVKEAASGLVQQLTGQQLLLNTDRTTPFAQVTLFLPLQGPDGEETASVHIQSRRGRKGELDAANCRLWFDLDMKQLGQTLVDVQVVDRIVSLKLHNNEPWVLELLEQRRDDIKVAVESIGYQLSGLRTEPLPALNVTTNSRSTGVGKFVDYAPDSYKGVDYRI